MPAKQTAQQIARQVARQTFEESEKFLKTAREQISPIPQRQEQQRKEEKPQEQEPTPPKTNRLMQTYNAELEEIRRDNLFKDLQRKIANGEDIPLESYQNVLSIEQLQVLKAQMEAIQGRKTTEESAKKQESIPQIVSKKARGMLNTFKKRQQQHVEMRQPPSG